MAKAESNQGLLITNTFANRLGSRIKTAKILTKLQKCALGKEEMTSVQFQAAKLLLNKTLPDAVQPKEQDSDRVKDVTHIPSWKLLEVVEGEVID
jgi:hypothetical protein